MAPSQLIDRSIVATDNTGGSSQLDLQWRWLDLRPSTGLSEPDSAHMQNDSALLEDMNRGMAPPTIRSYTWIKPAVTIGRLQDLSAVQAEFPNHYLYRRPTGGRAVLHEGDLTVAICASHKFLRRWLLHTRSEPLGVRETYTALVEPLRATLVKFGVATDMGGGDFDRPVALGKASSQDCFAASAECDVVSALTGKKLLGSAMRRTSAALLLQVSLRSIAGIDVTGEEFVRELCNAYEKRC